MEKRRKSRRCNNKKRRKSTRCNAKKNEMNKRCNTKRRNEEEECSWISLFYCLSGEEETERDFSFTCVCKKKKRRREENICHRERGIGFVYCFDNKRRKRDLPLKFPLLPPTLPTHITHIYNPYHMNSTYILYKQPQTYTIALPLCFGGQLDCVSRLSCSFPPRTCV